MIFKQSNLIIALSIGLQLQSGNASAFDLSDVTNAVDQVNSVAKQLNAPQSEPEPITPAPATPVEALPVATASTEIPKEFHGTWAKNCKSSNLEVEGIEVNKDGILGHEFHSEIKSARWIPNDRTLSVTSSMCEGEDCQAPTPQTWILEKSDKVLTIAGYSGTTEYSRCSSSSTSNASVTPVSVPSVSKVLFSCKAAKGKEIRLVNTGKGIEYSFGLANQKPDISVSVPYEKAFYASLGDARSTNFQVSIPNGKTYYVVYSYEYARGCGKCKSDFGHGVIVSKESKKITDVECDRKAKLEPTSNSFIYDMLDNLFDASDLLQSVTEEDSNFKSRGFFNIDQ